MGVSPPIFLISHYVTLQKAGATFTHNSLSVLTRLIRPSLYQTQIFTLLNARCRTQDIIEFLHQLKFFKILGHATDNLLMTLLIIKLLSGDFFLSHEPDQGVKMSFLVRQRFICHRKLFVTLGRQFVPFPDYFL